MNEDERTFDGEPKDAVILRIKQEVPPPELPPVPERQVVLTRASEIELRRVRWLWADRIPLGALSLLAGREGLGKSLAYCKLVADLTRGMVDGEIRGRPSTVLICATEDDWSYTIAPRLIVAGANLDLVYRVEVKIREGDEVRPDALLLPKDLQELRRAHGEINPSLLVLDPLISRLDSELDTHRDNEVRQALEPLVTILAELGMSGYGVIHHNKSKTSDPLDAVMGSRAFAAVARSVQTVIRDPDSDDRKGRIFGTVKNNLGQDIGLPLKKFEIDGVALDTPEGETRVGRLRWTEDVEGSIGELMRRASEDEAAAEETRHRTEDAKAWLEDFFDECVGREARRPDVIKAAHAAGHAERTIERARAKLKIARSYSGFPRVAIWRLEG